MQLVKNEDITSWGVPAARACATVPIPLVVFQCGRPAQHGNARVHRTSGLHTDTPEPFERAGADPETVDAIAYIATVRRLSERPTSAQRSFAATDEGLAANWHREDLPPETARGTILLVCRAQVDESGRPPGQPIRSLHYVELVLAEVREVAFPSSYWKHGESNLKRCERHWRAGPRHTPRACPPRIWNRQWKPGGTPQQRPSGRENERREEAMKMNPLLEQRVPLDGGHTSRSS